jgi:hypothetical protein
MELFYLGPKPIKPIFILGCGRSGTTILGLLISQHHRLCYLYEPHFIWVKGYPQTDLWSQKAQQRGGRLDLDASVCTPRQSRAIHKTFGFAQSIYRKQRLVTKSPEYTFRIPFLLSIFPDAQFIHVIRNGVETALSIEQKALQSAWYGWNHYKWNELQRIARTFPWGDEAVRLCKTDFQQGLLEWRLSLEIAFQYLERLPEERYIEVRYENLLASPTEVCEQIQEFLGEGVDRTMERYAIDHVSRQSPKPDVNCLSPVDHQITGDWFHRLGYTNTPNSH